MQRRALANNYAGHSRGDYVSRVSSFVFYQYSPSPSLSLSLSLYFCLSLFFLLFYPRRCRSLAQLLHFLDRSNRIVYRFGARLVVALGGFREPEGYQRERGLHPCPFVGFSCRSSRSADPRMHAASRRFLFAAAFPL